MKLWLIIGVIITVLGIGGTYYLISENRISKLTTQNELLLSNNATLIANNSVLEQANNQNIQTIDDLQLLYEQTQQDNSRLQSEFQIIRMQNDELRQRLSRHELDALAAARPGLVETRINNATENAARCFELLSGAPLNARELSAITDRQFNSECPWLFEVLRP